MGADNWAVCPKCSVNHEAVRLKAVHDATVLYGKIAAVEYEVRIAKARAIPPDFGSTTLREDYEIGIFSEGVFEIRYRGHCDKCGLSHVFRHREQLKLK